MIKSGRDDKNVGWIFYPEQSSFTHPTEVVLKSTKGFSYC